jgi:hypothetical protein
VCRGSTMQSFADLSTSQAISVRKDVHNVTPLTMIVAVHEESRSMIVDPTQYVVQESTRDTSCLRAHPSPQATFSIPDLSSAPTNPRISALKLRVDHAKPLGLIPSGETELLFIYDSNTFSGSLSSCAFLTCSYQYSRRMLHYDTRCPQSQRGVHPVGDEGKDIRPSRSPRASLFCKCH